MTTDSSVLERCRAAYESARRKRATMLSVPVMLVAALGVAVAPKHLLGALVGLIFVAAAWLCLVIGRVAERALFPGVVAGLIPLMAAQATRVIGHGCTGSACISLCLPACTVGGITAGLVLAWVGRQQSSPLFFVIGGFFSILVGAFGCSCIGYSGVIGLITGVVLTTSVPAAVRVTRWLDR